MPRRSDSRQRMVRTAAALLRRQGYAATGWRSVVAESGTPWGSQAHHFPGGKEQLAVDAVAWSGEAFERLLRGALANGHPADAVEAWTRLGGAELERSGWRDGCPVATVALETAHDNDALAAACTSAFGSWRSAIAEAIQARGVDEAAAQSLATFTLAAVEGALLLARAERSTEPLFAVGRHLSGVLRANVE